MGKEDKRKIRKKIHNQEYANNIRKYNYDYQELITNPPRSLLNLVMDYENGLSDSVGTIRTEDFSSTDLDKIKRDLEIRKEVEKQTKRLQVQEDESRKEVQLQGIRQIMDGMNGLSPSALQEYIENVARQQERKTEYEERQRKRVEKEKEEMIKREYNIDKPELRLKFSGQVIKMDTGVIHPGILDKLKFINDNQNIPNFELSPIEKLVLEAALLFENVEKGSSLLSIRKEVFSMHIDTIIKRYETTDRRNKRNDYLKTIPIPQLIEWPITSFTEELGDSLVTKLNSNAIICLKQCATLTDNDISARCNITYTVYRPLREFMVVFGLSWPSNNSHEYKEVIEPPAKLEIINRQRSIKL